MSLFRILHFLFLILLFSISNYSFAGLILEQVSYIRNNPDKKGKGKIYISDNKIKFVIENFETEVIFDLDKSKLIRIDHKSKTYAESSLQKYINAIQNKWLIEKKEIKRQLANMPEKQRTFKTNLLKQRGIDIYGDLQKNEITFKETKDIANINGYNMKKYELLEGGKLIEEIWLSKDLDELDYNKLGSYYGEMHKLSMNLFLDSVVQENLDETLQNLFKNGYPLKSVDYKTRGIRIEEVLNVKQLDIPTAEFSPPEGYKKYSL